MADYRRNDSERIGFDRLTVHRTAHIYTKGNPEKCEHIIIALHGYGQLASRLIRKFDVLHNCFIIAPEGLSKFYWNGVRGEVVASWMTSHERLDEIEDYIEYIGAVFSRYLPIFEGRKIHFFGFSQGCATLWRYLERTHPQIIDSICLWAGWLPEDVNFPSMMNYLENRPLYFIHGDEDEYLDSDRMTILKHRAHEEGLPIRYIEYHGKHAISRATLARWFDLVK